MCEIFDELRERYIAIGEARGKIEGQREGRIEGQREGRIEGQREGRIEGKVDMTKRIMSLMNKSLEEAMYLQLNDEEKLQIRQAF